MRRLLVRLQRRAKAAVGQRRAHHIENCPGQEPSRPTARLGEIRKSKKEDAMGKGILLWLLGIPLPIIVLFWH
jgi:hypothetical protein